MFPIHLLTMPADQFFVFFAILAMTTSASAGSDSSCSTSTWVAFVVVLLVVVVAVVVIVLGISYACKQQRVQDDIEAGVDQALKAKIKATKKYTISQHHMAAPHAAQGNQVQLAHGTEVRVVPAGAQRNGPVLLMAPLPGAGIPPVEIQLERAALLIQPSDNQPPQALEILSGGVVVAPGARIMNVELLYDENQM